MKERRRFAPSTVLTVAAAAAAICSSPAAAFSSSARLVSSSRILVIHGKHHHQALVNIPNLRRCTVLPEIRGQRQRHVSLGLSASSVVVPSVASCASRIIGHGVATFLAKWKTYSLIPVIAAFVGWFTNYLAVEMIFYPIRWRGLPIKVIEGEPLGFIGWQGIVPAKTAKMSDSMINVTLTELLSMEEIILRLEPERVADILLPEAPDMIAPIVEDVVPRNLRPIADNVLNSEEGSLQHRIKSTVARKFLIDLTLDVQRNIRKVLDVRGCVREQVMADRSLLGRLFQRTGGAELKFLVDSGLWFGGVLGLIQMIVALYWDNPWTLSAGGALVGLATNWIALKLIFEPVVPKPFGPFVLQGLFIRRQNEVAKDFADFFAKNILTSRQLWNSILTDPKTSPIFAHMFERNLKDLSKKTTRGIINIKDSAKLSAAISKTIAAFPQYLTNLHGYVDDALEIEETLRTKMMAMSPVRFERVLHPIFEEDEMTLILAGAFLGFLAGLVQQGLASGALVLPTLPLPALLAGCALVLPLLSMRVRNIVAFDISYVRRYFLRAANRARDLAKKGRGKITRKPRKVSKYHKL